MRKTWPLGIATKRKDLRIRMVSVVVPAWNEEKNVERCAREIARVLGEAGELFELIFVDDGSSDGTWDKLCALCERDESIRAIRLSRNFGKEGAIFAGLKAARGDCAAVMDCDMQHPPGVLVEMLSVYRAGDVDVVQAKKSMRGKEPLLHRWGAKLFYGLLQVTSGLDLRNASDFKLMSRAALDSLLDMPERQTFFRAMSGWVGYRTAEVVFEVPARDEGQTRWSLRALTKLALNAIAAYSTLPMQFVTFCGGVFFLFSVVMGIQTVYMKLSGQAIAGFTTVILILLIMGSIIMFSLGVIGLYLARIYEEVKRRPRYIVAETRGGERAH